MKTLLYSAMTVLVLSCSVPAWAESTGTNWNEWNRSIQLGFVRGTYDAWKEIVKLADDNNLPSSPMVEIYRNAISCMPAGMNYGNLHDVVAQYIALHKELWSTYANDLMFGAMKNFCAVPVAKPQPAPTVTQ